MAAATGFDEGNVYFSDQRLTDNQPPLIASVRKNFFNFLKLFRVNDVFVYRDQLRRRYNQEEYFVEIELADLRAWSGELGDMVLEKPNDVLPYFEQAAADVIVDITLTHTPHNIQVMINSNALPANIRNLSSANISRLVVIPGLIIGSTKTRPKATRITIQCKNCKNTKSLPCPKGIGSVSLPRICDREMRPTDTISKCPLDPYQIVPDRCEYVDQQSLKLQEVPESIPTGEMPRHIMLSCEKYLCGKIQPGMRCTITGIYSIFQSHENRKSNAAGAALGSSAGIRVPYIRALGINVESEGQGRVSYIFSAEEEADFRQMAQSPTLYESLSRSIAPAIFGHEDIKKALACQLFSGSRKNVSDSVRLRGDINVLLLGDPSTAKSQFLKFIEKVAPIGVYTSGKGSSAAGLTATVIRDSSTGEFYLEGGAMVMADGGIVCIDEFDKMREQDRVAIHEAMEQQTISIAKAGITTVLNSRTAVLAAANPKFGRFDDMKTATENIDFQSTILSRFDMIFIIRDKYEEEHDKTIANHVMAVHMNPANASREDNVEHNRLKRYIAFCRSRCSPRLSAAGASALQDHYVRVRSNMKSRSESHNYGPQAIPITVRQLEAIIRISESLAKMQLKNEVEESHVQEAMRLFQVSTLLAANSGVPIEGMMSTELQEEVSRIENELRRVIAVGERIAERRVINNYTPRFSEDAIKRCIQILVHRGEFEYQNQQKVIYRLR